MNITIVAVFLLGTMHRSHDPVPTKSCRRGFGLDDLRERLPGAELGIWFGNPATFDRQKPWDLVKKCWVNQNSMLTNTVILPTL